jgi:predicted nuclease with TOPRIM domain
MYRQFQITPITRWSDLPEPDQKFLEDLEKYITEQKSISEDLTTRTHQLEEYVQSIPSDVAEVQKRFDAIAHILTVDNTLLTSDLKPKVYPPPAGLT